MQHRPSSGPEAAPARRRRGARF